ncbi:MAG TPA: MG2 domain-containing protein [Bryobacteraceae bacterium]|nr:MG2 domain-containing protein [Bryobacteraceae bacterium]
MKAPYVGRVLLALLMAAPIVCQSESQPYFSLSSDRTFGGADTPAVSLAGTHVEAVQIRVYRVKNPVEFYRKIESPHNFGAQEQQRITKHSFLGSVRIWKHDLRRRIRLFLRGQFTESVSAHFRTPRKEEKTTANTRENYFASTPLLNRDQLVLSFVQPLSKQNWSSLSVPIRVREKGIYLVEAVSGGLRAYTIVIKSNLVLVTKVGRQRITAFVADRISGEPVSGAKLQVMTRDGAPAIFETNANGLTEIKAPVNAGTRDDELRVVASKENDITLNALSLWSYGEAARTWTGYIYTDRPVYRPRDTIHFRGILRAAKSPNGYTIPAGQTFAVQIQDPDGKQIYTKHLAANSNGIIHDEFTSDRTAALGAYYIQVAGGEIPMTGNFEIQDYKKPEYEVRVTATKPRVLEGKKIEAMISARYYFGEPVKNAKVEYSLYRTRYFYPLWQDADETPMDSEMNNSGDEEDAGEEVLRAQGQLDGDGKLQVSYPTTVSDHGHDYRYRIEARVTDEARREISGTGWVIATYGTFLVNAEPQRYFYEPGSQAELTLKAVDYDGKPVSTAATIELLRLDPRRPEERKVVKTTTAKIGTDGTGKAELPLMAQGGSYEIRVSAQSGNGRRVESSTYIWIAASGESSFFVGGNARNLQIVADKRKYAAGETAKLLVITGRANAPVLVTVEGRDVRLTKLLHSNSATVSFDYQVSADDQPGFFVSAQFIRNGEMYQGQKRVSVPPEQHKLDVHITTDKQTYEPGQTATYALQVTTPDGKPVPGADLSLGVVDEAIYAIRADATPDLLTFFYGNEGDNVNTLDSLTYYFNGEAGNRRMLLAMGTATQMRLAQIKQEPLVQPKIRKAFPDTSYWAADLKTDDMGSIRTKVTFPDSLTTWRATAKGATATDRFGGGVEKTLVRKNIIVRLSIPRFFVEGDETVISAIVHDYLPSAKHARVSIALAGLDIITGSATQEADVPSRGDVKIDWRVKTKTGSETKITASALTGQESDAVEMSVPIRPQGVSIHHSKGGTVEAGGSVNQQINFPADAEPGSRSVSIRLSSSAAGSIFNALDFLTSFPYGCVEQTMSSFLPNLMVTKALHAMNGVPRMDEKQLKEQVTSGLERLYGMQHEDGGWGWWSSDQSQTFMTGYVVAGLAEAKADGVAVRVDVVEKGVRWLQAEIRKDTGLEPDMQAYAAYALALAGSPDSALNGRIYATRFRLSPYGVALLGLVFERLKDQRASALASALESSVSQTSEEAWWVASRDEMLDFEADVTPEATAYAVKLLTHERRNSPLLPKAVLWLVNHRNEGSWWSSSKQTAMVIYGVLDYLKAGNELTPDFTAIVKLNGQIAATQKFGEGSAVAAPEIFLDEAKLQPGANQISVTTSGKGRLYYSVIGTHYSNAARMEKEGVISLNVLRDYFRLIPAQQGDHTVYDLAPLHEPLSSGDIIAVRLTVTGSDWKYLLAEDPIPAGTEFIERDSLYQLRSRPPWWQYLFSRRELHDDHMAIFQTYFSQGQQQYFYLLKVVNPGVFHVGPARVSPMYQPGIEATSESRTVEVRP